MIEITGEYTNARIRTDIVEPETIKQVTLLCNHPLFKNKRIEIMPDCHPSKATVVGLVCETDLEHIIPQLLGNDIGCSVSAYLVKGKTLNDYAKLNKVIRNIKPKQRDSDSCDLYLVCNFLCTDY